MSDTLVKVENVSKKFCRSLKRSLWYGVRDVGAELIGRGHSQNGLPPLRTDEFWAVQDINFELKRGDCLGLIGRNGAGKSTLLKMLNGLLKPDTGRIEMRGRIGALIELGTGFNPILTGRENVYVNGSVLGFSKKELDALFDDILDFSEIGDFIDTPVKNYSSGMKVRLGFSVAVHLKPDVLLLDEVLAVGDTGFKIKSLNRMTELISHTAVIFVHHSMPIISRICNKVLLLNDGQCKMLTDDVPEAILEYNSSYESEKPSVAFEHKARLLSFEIEGDTDEHHIKTLNYLDDLVINLTVQVDPSVEEYHITLNFFDKNLQNVANYDASITGQPLRNNGSINTIKIAIPKLPFSAGNYSISTTLLNSKPENQRREFLAAYRHNAQFNVIGGKIGFAAVYLNGTVTATA